MKIETSELCSASNATILRMHKPEPCKMSSQCVRFRWENHGTLPLKEPERETANEVCPCRNGRNGQTGDQVNNQGKSPRNRSNRVRLKIPSLSVNRNWFTMLKDLLLSKLHLPGKSHNYNKCKTKNLKFKGTPPSDLQR